MINDDEDDTLLTKGMSTTKAKDPQPLDALQVVRLFLELCAQGNHAQAMTMLDDHVQVSYPGLPFIKSARQWYRKATTTTAGRAAWSDHCHGWAEAPQNGCCAGQVIRRSKRCHNHKSSAGFIEVFHVDSDNHVKAAGPRIVAMYLRKAPSKWMSRPNNKGSSSHRADRETRCDDDVERHDDGVSRSTLGKRDWTLSCAKDTLLAKMDGCIRLATHTSCLDGVHTTSGCGKK